MENIDTGQGISDAEDPYKAGKQAAKEAMENYDGEEKPDIGFVFCSGSKYGKNDETIEKFVEGVNEEFGDIEWVGATSAGEISKEGFTQGTAVATVISSEMMYWGINVEEIDEENPEESGKKAAQGALDNLDIDKTVHSYSQYQFLKNADTSEMMSADSYNMIVLAQGPGTEAGGFGQHVRLLKGIKDVIKANPVVGGLAGDDERLLRNYQIYNGQILSNGIIAVSLVTTLDTGFKMAHGYKSQGEIALATDVDVNVVGKLNNSPAAEEYANMLDKDLNDLLPKSLKVLRKLKLEKGVLKLMQKRGKNIFEEHPLAEQAVRHPLGFSDESGNIWIKTPADILEGKKLKFLNEVPENSALQLLSYGSDEVYETSKSTIEKIKSDISHSGLIFAFECFQRLNLFEEEVRDLSDEYTVGGNCIPLGFATYGEIGTSSEGVSGGQTITLTSMGVSDKVFKEED
ncbi:MAG: FIST C-terminal domain-containing protein [Candidatus Nanohaloarchaeota archaeon QJJ-9]|nr:FIST C-terminal domain-containing protein [Candidatus Nanohaloarchaeota archaeon QJJ-9]